MSLSSLNYLQRFDPQLSCQSRSLLRGKGVQLKNVRGRPMQPNDSPYSSGSLVAEPRNRTGADALSNCLTGRRGGVGLQGASRPDLDPARQEGGGHRLAWPPRGGPPQHGRHPGASRLVQAADRGAQTGGRAPPCQRARARGLASRPRTPARPTPKRLPAPRQRRTHRRARGPGRLREARCPRSQKA